MRLKDSSDEPIAGRDQIHYGYISMDAKIKTYMYKS